MGYLKWGKVSGLARCPIKVKFNMGEEFIPSLHRLLYKYPKSGWSLWFGHDYWEKFKL